MTLSSGAKGSFQGAGGGGRGSGGRKVGEASRHAPPAFQAADEALLRGAQAGALQFGLLSEV